MVSAVSIQYLNIVYISFFVFFLADFFSCQSRQVVGRAHEVVKLQGIHHLLPTPVPGKRN